MASYDLFVQPPVPSTSLNSSTDALKKFAELSFQSFVPPALLNSKANVLKKPFALFLQPLAAAPTAPTYHMRGYLTPSGPYVQWSESGTPGISNAPGPVTDVAILFKSC